MGNKRIAGIAVGVIALGMVWRAGHHSGTPTKGGAAERPAADQNASIKASESGPESTQPSSEARPGWIIGRAVFADGRPVPNFTVNAAIGYKVGVAEGSNGQYAIQVTDPTAIIVHGFTAKAILPFNGQNYVLEMQPTDGLSDDEFFHQSSTDVQKGVVRDFVLRLTGTKPGYTAVTPDSVLKNDSFNVRSSFWGAELQIETALDSVIPQDSSLQVTLTPTGPLVDGSAGQVIQRVIPQAQPNNQYIVYDIPLGVYTASINLMTSDGASRPLHLKMKINGTESGPDPQEAVSVSWPFDERLNLLPYPLVRIEP